MDEPFPYVLRLSIVYNLSEFVTVIPAIAILFGSCEDALSLKEYIDFLL